jgi:hypothetical protein
MEGSSASINSSQNLRHNDHYSTHASVLLILFHLLLTLNLFNLNSLFIPFSFLPVLSFQKSNSDLSLCADRGMKALFFACCSQACHVIEVDLPSKYKTIGMSILVVKLIG